MPGAISDVNYPIVRELVEAGAMPIQVAIATWDPHRCRCGHMQGIHPKDGPCQARACRKFGGCEIYREDPAFALPKPPPPGTIVRHTIEGLREDVAAAMKSAEKTELEPTT